MADEPVSPTGARSGEDGTRLPVPAGSRVPAGRAPAGVSVERAARLVIRAAAQAPLVAAAVAGAGAAVAVSGAAAVTRLLSPWSWVRGRSAPEDAQPPAARMHVSYTHVEIHWRTVR